MTWKENVLDGTFILTDSKGMIAGVHKGSVKDKEVWIIGCWTDDTRMQWHHVGYAKTLKEAKTEAFNIATYYITER